VRRRACIQRASVSLSGQAQTSRAEGAERGSRRMRHETLSRLCSPPLTSISSLAVKPKPSPVQLVHFFEMRRKIAEKVKGGVTKVKDAAQSLRPSVTSRPSSRISTRPTTPIPTTESNLPNGTEENRLASAPIVVDEGAQDGPSGASRLPVIATRNSRP
jgi:hypothetical protein